MSIIDKLASSQLIRNTEPNKELADQLAKSGDAESIKELVANLNNKNTNIQSDCIKVLYELAERKPALVAGYAKEFIALLDSKNNRLQWGAMTALDMITSENADLIYKSLGKIIAVADKGSVITTDHYVGILLKLCAFKQYADDALELLMEQLQKAPVNQFPAYAEKTLVVVTGNNKVRLLSILTERLPDIDTESKRKRVEKVIKKLNK